MHLARAHERPGTHAKVTVHFSVDGTAVDSRLQQWSNACHIVGRWSGFEEHLDHVCKRFGNRSVQFISLVLGRGRYAHSRRPLVIQM